MKAIILVLAVLLLSAGTSALADTPAVSVEWSFGLATNRHAVVIAIKNLSGQEIKIQHPGNRQAIAVVVMDAHGNVIVPEGVAKVDPRHQDIVLKAGETFEHMDNQLTKLAQEKGMTLPFLTGTGLFAYTLKAGATYRVTVVFRPYADGEGVASAEKVLTFK